MTFNSSVNNSNHTNNFFPFFNNTNNSHGPSSPLTRVRSVQNIHNRNLQLPQSTVVNNSYLLMSQPRSNNNVRLDKINSNPITIPSAMVGKRSEELNSAIAQNVSRNLIKFNSQTVYLLTDIKNQDKKALIKYLNLIKETFDPKTYAKFKYTNNNKSLDCMKKLSKMASEKNHSAVAEYLKAICLHCDKAIHLIENKTMTPSYELNKRLGQIEGTMGSFIEFVSKPLTDLSNQKINKSFFNRNNSKDSTEKEGAKALLQLNKLALETISFVKSIYSTPKDKLQIISITKSQDSHSLLSLKNRISETIKQFKNTNKQRSNDMNSDILNKLRELEKQCDSGTPSDKKRIRIEQQLQQITKMNSNSFILKNIINSNEYISKQSQDNKDKIMMELRNWAKEAASFEMSYKIQLNSDNYKNKLTFNKLVDTYLIKALTHVLDPTKENKDLKEFAGFNTFDAIKLMDILLSFYEHSQLSKRNNFSSTSRVELRLVKEDLKHNLKVYENLNLNIKQHYSESYKLAAGESFDYIKTQLNSNKISTHYFGFTDHAITINFKPHRDNNGNKYVDIMVFNMWPEEYKNYATPKCFRVSQEDFNKNGKQAITSLLKLKLNKEKSLKESSGNIMLFNSIVESGFGKSTQIPINKKMHAQQMGTCSITNLTAASMFRIDGDRVKFDRHIQELNKEVTEEVRDNNLKSFGKININENPNRNNLSNAVLKLHKINDSKF